tara:strand:- start:385 stop:948 length:564 start_codon:yes stop_codon:yes gene_type:complete
MKKSIRGFTLVEMLIVIVAVGIIGSITTRLLYQGSELFIRETNRQTFVNEARSTFWRTMREAHGQFSISQFTSSGSNLLYLKDANDNHNDIETKKISIESQSINLKNGDNQNILSNYFLPSSDGITYYDNSYNEIIPSQNGLSEQQAKTIHIVKIDFIFNNDEDNIILSSYIYPYNFKYGEKMGYHD